MKKTGLCPKCGSKEIKGPEPFRAKIYKREASSFVCIKCGYVETYVEVFQ